MAQTLKSMFTYLSFHFILTIISSDCEKSTNLFETGLDCEAVFEQYVKYNTNCKRDHQ